jgi:hypothetical protein
VINALWKPQTGKLGGCTGIQIKHNKFCIRRNCPSPIMGEVVLFSHIRSRKRKDTGGRRNDETTKQLGTPTVYEISSAPFGGMTLLHACAISIYYAYPIEDPQAKFRKHQKGNKIILGTCSRIAHLSHQGRNPVTDFRNGRY